MKRLILRSILFSMIFTGVLPRALADYWTQKANYPGNGSSRAFYFSIGDKGYFSCGDDIGYASDTWEYDTTSNTWTQMASFGGGGRWSGVSFAVAGFGFAGLGWGSTMMDDIWKFDPVANTWTQMNNFPAGQRQVPASFVIGDKGYIATGRNISNIFQTDLWEYDPSNDSWAQKSNMPGPPRSQPFAFAIDSFGYVGGGFNQALTGLNDFYEYNPATDSWTQKASIPASGRGDPAGFAIGCRGYTATGQTLPVNSVLNELWEFDPSTNQWFAKAPFGGSARDESSFFVIGTKAFLGLGGVNGSFLTHDFWEYTPDTTCISVNPSALFIAANHICPGTCTGFTNLSVNATSFFWMFPGANPSTSTDPDPASVCYPAPGVYPVTLIASNGFGSDTLTLNNYITVYPYPPPQGIFQNGDTLFANTGAAGYQWYHDGLPIPGATDYYYIAPEGGNYNVVATDANGCEVEAVIFDVLAGLSLQKVAAKFLIFPNPTCEQLTISTTPYCEGHLTVFDASGKRCAEFYLPGSSTGISSFDIGDLQQGLYFLGFKSDGQTTIHRFIKH